MFKLSDEGALKEIKKLINLDIIKSEGKGKGGLYNIF
jgi:predicted HTH transcriptional regulator